MRVLILGCGYTGTWLARSLQAQGIDVVMTNRRGEPPPELSTVPCFPFTWEQQGEPVPLAPAALEGVTHILNSIPPDRQGEDAVALALLPQLEKLNLHWFGYLSTTGVYGDRQGGWVDETTPVNPQNLRSQHRVSIEQTFLNSNLPTHIFRLPGIYGPGEGRNPIARILKGDVQLIDKPGHYFCRIHVVDIVQTLERSLAQPTPQEIYNLSDDQPSESLPVLLEAYRLLGRPAPPAIPLEAANLSPMAQSFWRESRRVRNDKIKRVLGVQLRYPSYREGLLAIARELGL
ncbi:SDR family oxidoreductase [Thermosynechococcus sp. JY1334]|uniref:SDR family oxidoreductase n=1 Tax=unclassified Thermosynechococcus TaxID=2622553 RepID=UPI002672698D|nr:MULTISPECIES: SDR family oxidoreductase [unclassified Thermosynechococcus]MDR7898658.1 SDR family oxidoreductase [Thermosynechococcus sp. JY1332]MDR7906062.1 SDR family oxidoreductase [Thermosynechococcus sp. JY1334]MDR7993881.1 SDR family oxidoreductase [Thermosynechococcus sp. TG252]WKT85792.1 SDR family oxidoreductase [Thermosynechococcus sp. JY1339]WNC54736.1 SDR family oxidoreductase [Thermosynechococcus sp. JY1331]